MKKNQKNGISIFIAVVIMGILLFLSFAVINIAIKATLFASSGRDSQYAFYAADAGVECAVYWDSKYDAFATSTSGDGLTFTCGGSPDINTGQAVAGTSTPARIGGGGSGNPTSVFGFKLDQGSNPVPYCAIVMVTKYYGGQDLKTYIKSRGYNTCDTDNPRRVERGVEVAY